MSGIWEAMRASETQRLAAVERLRERVKELIGETAFMTADEETARLVDIVDGLRESLKAVDAVEAVCEVNTDVVTECPFHDSITVGGCNARRSERNGDWCPCARHPAWKSGSPGLVLPCRLDEGPIIVKKAGSEESDGPEKLSGLAAAVEEAQSANASYLHHCVKEWVGKRLGGDL